MCTTCIHERQTMTTNFASSFSTGTWVAIRYGVEKNITCKRKLDAQTLSTTKANASIGELLFCFYTDIFYETCVFEFIVMQHWISIKFASNKTFVLVHLSTVFAFFHSCNEYYLFILVWAYIHVQLVWLENITVCWFDAFCPRLEERGVE